jgi:peroxiredoxin
MDDRDTAHRFKESLKAPYSFVGDPKGELVKAFDVKAFLLPISKRITFVVGPKREVLSISEGNDAIDPSGAVAACSLKPPEALKYVTGPKDGGTP